MPMTLPAIRSLEVFPVRTESRELYGVRDPEGYVEDMILLSPASLFIASRLTGKNGIPDIQKAFVDEAHTEPPKDEEIRKLVKILDERGFLHTETFVKLRDGVISKFQKQTDRPPYFAEKSYPKRREELATFLNEQFLREGGPGRLPDLAKKTSYRTTLLIAPHIDYKRGGHSYAHGYLKLAEMEKPDLAIIFGVAHVGPPSPFILTRKNFETPFGVLPTRQDIVQELEGACEWDPYQDEIVHRTEHSVELQVVMLAHIFGTDLPIVPILCGTFGRDAKKLPSEKGEIQTFLSSIQTILRRGQERILVVVGADLAHVGKRFGDSFDIDDDVLQVVEARDGEDLAFALQIDADGFFASIMKDKNERRVCGLHCIYAGLKSVEGIITHGELLHYDSAPDPFAGAVSFATLIASA